MATFAPSFLDMAQNLGKYIGLILLMVFVKTWPDKQEITETHEAMPQTRCICTLQSEQSITERAIAHLFAEQIAIPYYISGEIPGYHPQHSKSTRVQTSNKHNRYGTQSILSDKSIHSSASIHYHVIDYYIYTLEHILI